jgi:hypothetical protein
MAQKDSDILATRIAAALFDPTAPAPPDEQEESILLFLRLLIVEKNSI